MFVSQDGSNLPILPSQRAPNLYMVPQGIRPVVQLTAIEVSVLLCFYGSNQMDVAVELESYCIFSCCLQCPIEFVPKNEIEQLSPNIPEEI